MRRPLLACLAVLLVSTVAAGCAGKVEPFYGNAAPGCTSTTDATCSGQAYSCVPGSFPYGVEGVTLECSSPVVQASGDSSFCCTPSTGTQTSECTWNSASSSSCSSLAFKCKAGADPATLDPQLTCNAGSPDADGTHTDYCCAYASDAATGG